MRAYPKLQSISIFGDKDSVLNAVCVWLTERCLQALVIQVEAGVDTVVRMMGFMQVLSDFIRSGEQALCSELGAVASLSAKQYSAFEEKARVMIFALIREGKSAHLIDMQLSEGIDLPLHRNGALLLQGEHSIPRTDVGGCRFQKSFFAFDLAQYFYQRVAAENRDVVIR